MNLKESFRIQGVINRALEEIENYLSIPNLITTLTQIHKKGVATGVPGKDEKIVVNMDRKYPYATMDIVNCYVSLQELQTVIGKAISEAKRKVDFDLDELVASNKKRQSLVKTMKAMSQIPASTNTVTWDNGFKLNVSGEQVSYRYEIENIRTIDFDRTQIIRIHKKYSHICDEVSNQIERAMLDIYVDFDCPYEPTDSTSDIIEKFVENFKSA